MNRRIGISALLLVAVFCLALALITAVGGFMFLRPGGLVDQSGLSTGLPSLPVEMYTATHQPGEATMEPSPDDGATPQAQTTQMDTSLPANVREQMDQIQAQVSEVRGLEMDEGIERDVLSDEQLRERVINDFFAEYSAEEMLDDQQVLSAFGLIPADFDLYQLYIDVYSEQIAGFYDDEERAMYVVGGEAFGGPERMTYAHEFTHALQDQTYGLRDGMKMYEEYCSEHSEYCAAVQALIEGDASLTEQLWLFGYSTEADRQQIQDFYQDYTSPVFDRAPEYLRQDFSFPYAQGLNFVQDLYNRGGFEAVDAAYSQPPASTEQILHPERYPDDQPLEVSLPDLTSALGEGWRELDRNTLGEWYTYLTLSAGREPAIRLNAETAAPAAEGWGGDQYAVYSNADGSQTVLALQTTWDSDRDRQQFASAFKQYGQMRWGQPAANENGRVSWTGTVDGEVLFMQQGQQTLWLLAPDADTQNRVLEALPDF